MMSKDDWWICQEKVLFSKMLLRVSMNKISKLNCIVYSFFLNFANYCFLLNQRNNWCVCMFYYYIATVFSRVAILRFSCPLENWYLFNFKSFAISEYSNPYFFTKSIKTNNSWWEDCLWITVSVFEYAIKLSIKVWFLGKVVSLRVESIRVPSLNVGTWRIFSESPSPVKLCSVPSSLIVEIAPIYVLFFLDKSENITHRKGFCDIVTRRWLWDDFSLVIWATGNPIEGV